MSSPKIPRTGTMDIIESANWHQLQDHFSSITGLSLATYDAAANLIGTTSLDNPLCQAFRATEKGMEQCQGHCMKYIRIAAESRETLFFKCAANLHVFAVPIVVEESTKVVFYGGKAFYSYEDLSVSRTLAEQFGISPEEMLRVSKDIPFRQPNLLRSAASFIEHTGRYMFENARYRERFGVKFAQLMTLFSVGSELREAESKEKLYPIILHTLGVLFNLQTAAFLQADPKTACVLPIEVFGENRETLAACSILLREGLFDQLMHSRRPLSCNIPQELAKSGFPPSVELVHLFPLIGKHSRARGAIAICNSTLSTEDVKVISSFTQQVSLIFDNVTLQQELADRADSLSALIEINRTIGSSLESEELFTIILDKCTDFMKAEQGSLMLLDEDNQELSIKAIRGLNPAIVGMMRIRPGEGIAGKVLATGAPLVVQDIETDDRVATEKRPRYKTKSFISLPLKLRDRIIGVLNIADKISGEVFTDQDLQFLRSLAGYASVAIERSEFYQKSEELRRISITDGLTGLLNRRYFNERLTEEVERSKRHQIPVSLIIIDIDDFKGYNDTFGHPAGDEALKAISRCLRVSIRSIDVAARYGGEEFTVILPQTSKEDAAVIAQRILKEIQRLDLAALEAQGPWSMTVSIGLASFPTDANTLEDLIQKADKALYMAKAAGKNRVVLYPTQS